jgi:Flp pilus assembly pilin Flp
MSHGSSWQKLIRRIHRDERGAVSLETILIIAAIALPILIFILKFGWPKIRDYFKTGMDNLEQEGQNTTDKGFQ